MSKANGAPLTRREFQEAMNKLDKRLVAIEDTQQVMVRVLGMVAVALKIQDDQITDVQLNELSKSDPQ